MTELVFGQLLKNICIFSGLIGFIAGLDLLTGAKITSITKAGLDKALDFDKAIKDKKGRFILGFLFIFISTLMLILVYITR